MSLTGRVSIHSFTRPDQVTTHGKESRMLRRQIDLDHPKP